VQGTAADVQQACEHLFELLGAQARRGGVPGGAGASVGAASSGGRLSRASAGSAGSGGDMSVGSHIRSATAPALPGPVASGSSAAHLQIPAGASLMTVSWPAPNLWICPVQEQEQPSPSPSPTHILHLALPFVHLSDLSSYHLPFNIITRRSRSAYHLSSWGELLASVDKPSMPSGSSRRARSRWQTPTCTEVAASSRSQARLEPSK